MACRSAGRSQCAVGISARPLQVNATLQNFCRATNPSAMGPSPAQIERVAARLVRQLVEAKVVELTANEQAVAKRFSAVLTKNFNEEAEIEQAAAVEAEKLVRQGAPGIRRDELDLRQVEKLVKARIAKQRGFVL